MDASPLDSLDETQLAHRLLEVLAPLMQRPALRRMRIRLAEEDNNVLDEPAQLRLFVRAVLDDAELDAALQRAGFGDLKEPTGLLDPWTGRLTQAFNRLVERHWEDR